MVTTRYNNEITVSLPQNLQYTEVGFSADLSCYSRGLGEQENLEGKEQMTEMNGEVGVSPYLY